MISKKLIKIRTDLDLTQEQVAKKLGVSRSSYSVWETGRDIIPLKHLNHFSNMFDISLDYLVGFYNINNINFQHIELDKQKIGMRLKEIRNKNHLSQEYVASKLHTHHSTISAYETGKNLILTAFIIDFAKLTDTSIDYLCCKID